MTDPFQLLHSPLGVPGSGQQRHDAAMALWREGLLDAPALEIYRIASADDARDPLPMLAEAGLPPPPGPADSPAERWLYQVARVYLAGLDHPGRDEVMAGLPADPGPLVPPARSEAEHPVVARWLGPALSALSAERPVLAAAIARAAPALDWHAYDSYPPDKIGPGFAGGHAYATLVGTRAPYPAPDFDAGLFLIAPGVLYRDHCHAAPELYAPLTGPHGWRFGPGLPLERRPAHVPVWNPPFRPHLTKAGTVPFLCLFIWTRDVHQSAEVIPADDWPTLEALVL